jgi:hypothetical protein
MFIYENPIQCRTITGSITRNQRPYKPNGQLEQGNLLDTYFVKGRPSRPRALSLKKLIWNGIPLLDPDYGIMVDPKENLMRGHLVKAAWDGGNSDDRITQWRNDRSGRQEQAWTQIEGVVEQYAAQNIPCGDHASITTTTLDSNLPAVLLLGSEENFRKEYPVQSGRPTTSYQEIHEVLSRQIQSAKIAVKNQEVDSIRCPECETGLRLNPHLIKAPAKNSMCSNVLTGLGIGFGAIGTIGAMAYGLIHSGLL